MMGKFHGWAAAALLAATPAGAAVQTINSNGILIGATNVDIGGTLYNVEFIDGTCASIFAGCNERSDFILTDNMAFTAAAALIDQVFTGIYDTNPELTLGCGDPLACVLYVPYYDDSGRPGRVNSATAQNFSPSFPFPDGVYPTDIYLPGDSSENNFFAYARFTIAGSVPEPAAWSLMIIGFGAIGFFLRRRERVAKSIQMA